MRVPQLAPNPHWKQFLRLGEELIRLSSVAEQVDLITQTGSTWLEAKVSVWLAAPFYPLPGQPTFPVLPEAPAPETVLQAFEHRESVWITPTPRRPGRSANVESPQVAVPMVSQDLVLGVIYAERPQGIPFRESELANLNGFAAHAAMALQVTRQIAIKNWRSEQLGLVRSVSAQIANIMDQAELCRRVVMQIQLSFRYYAVSLFTLDPRRKMLSFRAGVHQGREMEENPFSDVSLGEGMIGRAAQTGKELIAQDVATEPFFRPIAGLPATQSEIALPLKVENRVLGVLDVQNNQAGGFHEVDLIVLRALADSIALAFEGANLYTDLQRRADQVAMVLELSHILSSILDLDELLAELVQLIQKRFGYPFVHVYTVHPLRRKVIYRAGSGARSQAFLEEGLAYDLDNPMGLIPSVARSGTTYYAADVNQDPLYRYSEIQPDLTRSELTIPITFADEVLGVLDVQSGESNGFDENHRSVLESVAASIAVAMRNANLFRTERWRRQVADSFRDVAGMVSAGMAVDELLDVILSRLEKSLPCDVSAIWLMNDLAGGDGRLHPASAHGTSIEKIIESVGKSPASLEFLLSALDKSRPLIRAAKDLAGPLGIAMDFQSDYSSIAAPMRAGDLTLGVITLAHHTPNRYGSEAQDLTMTFANYAAVAIQNARLYSQAQEQAYISTVLLQVSEAAQSVTSLEDLLESIVHLTPLLIGVKKCGVFLWDERQKSFQLQATYGFEIPDANRTFSEANAPALGRLHDGPTTVFIQNAAAELSLPEAFIAPSETVVAVPIVAHGELLGAFLVTHVITGQTGARRGFSDQTLAILQGIVHQTAVALENLRLMEARQEESYVTAVLLQVAQAVASQNELDDILETIIHLLPILFGIDTALIYLWDREAQVFRAAHAFAGNHAAEKVLLEKTYHRGEYELLDQVVGQNVACVSPLIDGDTPPDAWPSLPCLPARLPGWLSTAPGRSWLYGLPLSVKGEIYGVMVARDTAETTASHERRLELLNGVAQQIALAIQNDQLTLEMIKRERLEREIQLARQIQKAFLPDQMPEIAGWELGARWETARTVGGDFYDIFYLDDDHLALVVADVADKGLPAALYMTVTRTLVRADAQEIHSPALILERVNRQLLTDSQDGMFVTAVLGVLHLASGRLVYANAGHNRPYLIHAATGHVSQLPKGGTALGVVEEPHIVDHEVTLHNGDALLLYTDGLTEAFSADEEIFGDERLVSVLRSCNERQVNCLIARIDSALSDFRGGAEVSDDLTLLAIHRNE